MTDSGPKPVAYYPALDGFRAIAVLLVFTCHYMFLILPYLQDWGWMGVDFFFVLSGFLITGILYDSRGRKHRFRDFYARRMLRIFPLYYGVWLLLLLLTPVFHWSWSAGWLLWPVHLGNFARYLFPLASAPAHMEVLSSGSKHLGLGAVYVGHFWSLCVEEQFYLVWPLVVLLVRSRRALLGICISIVLVEPVVRMIVLHTVSAASLSGGFVYRATFTRLDPLAMGALLALLLRDPATAAALHRFGRLLTWLSIALFTAFLVLYVHRSHTSWSNLGDHFLLTVGLSTVALLGGGIILELIRVGSTVARVLTWRPLRSLGQISYGFYIFHDLPHDFYIAVARHLGGNLTWMVAVLGLVGTTIVSSLSYRFYEVPFLRLKTRFASQVHRAPEV